MIEVVNIAKSFKEKQVLKKISFFVNKGETLALIGGSGSGKSTILRIITALLKPTIGYVLIDKKNITKANDKKRNEIRRNMGVVFQFSALFDFLTVGENVGFMLRRNKEPEEKIKNTVEKVLDMVGLAHAINMMPSELSGGMKKRIGFARAIAPNPKIILYDEPTSGLDPVTTAGINKLMLSIKKEFGTTAVLVTHDMKSVYKTADKIAFLYKGELLEIGKVEEVKNSQNPFIRQFIHGLDYLPTKEKSQSEI